MGLVPWLRLPRLGRWSRLEQAPVPKVSPTVWRDRKVRTRRQKRVRVAAMVGRRQNVKRLRKAHER